MKMREVIQTKGTIRRKKEERNETKIFFEIQRNKLFS